VVVDLEVWTENLWRLLLQPFRQGFAFLFLKLNANSTVLRPLILHLTSSLLEVSLSLSLSLSLYIYIYIYIYILLFCSFLIFIDSEVLSGLSWSVDEKSLKDAFSSFGDVTEGKMRLDIFLGLSLLPIFLTWIYVLDVLSHWSVVAKVGTSGCLEV